MAKRITITLYMSELLYDIRNKTFLSARINKTDDNYRQASHLQADEDEENNNEVLRSIGSAWGKLKLFLSAYINEEQSTGNDILRDETKDIVVILDMPDRFQESAVESMSTAMHRFIVGTVLWKWYRLLGPEIATTWKDEMDEVKSDLTLALSRRSGRSRITLSPFENKKT